MLLPVLYLKVGIFISMCIIDIIRSLWIYLILFVIWGLTWLHVAVRRRVRTCVYCSQGGMAQALITCLSFTYESILIEDWNAWKAIWYYLLIFFYCFVLNSRFPYFR